MTDGANEVLDNARTVSEAAMDITDMVIDNSGKSLRYEGMRGKLL